ncbi:armadillo-type protein [Syncephalastrum racemosum]|uniref:Armadillo-type protein n=1 Tax=Syncephalastrum racemosum TaxID=13706 RepID=A0A1X2H929_SYNRA|nr:armadillo-type protein [Syncephalastrum racemosum]
MQYKRNSIPRTPEELHQRRRLFDESLRRKHREQLITAKRFRNLTRQEERESTGEPSPSPPPALVEHDEDIDPYYRLTTDQVNDLARDLKSTDKDRRADALQYLSKFVVEPAQALIDYIVQGDCIDTLTVRSNIAAGPYDLWIKSVSTVPLLVSFLDSDNVTLKEMAAGALGNMAAEDLGDNTTEDDEVRTMIRNNGAVQPLVRMLDTSDPGMVQSACFALANLSRGTEHQLHEFFEAGIGPRLLHHLEEDTVDTITEVCWVLSYLTAASEMFRRDIMNHNAAALLMRDLRNLSDEGAAVLPVLRTIGNLCGGPDEYIQNFLDQPRFMHYLLALTRADHRKRPEIIKTVVEEGAMECLSDSMEHNGAFDIRKGAATCLLNLAYHGEKYTDKMPHQKLLPGFLELIRSEDADLMTLGLSYVDILLHRVQKGRELIEISDCMRVLGSVNPVPDTELYHYANKLVDEFYQETPAMDAIADPQAAAT